MVGFCPGSLEGMESPFQTCLRRLASSCLTCFDSSKKMLQKILTLALLQLLR
jgi:hypothetical protein